ncbi:MAG TPA: phage capsid protein [Anaerohalosphaeraceae bacterium]|nr:phage capsid protein [Anaerohalosphaeraceae bacterium]
MTTYYENTSLAKINEAFYASWDATLREVLQETKDVYAGHVEVDQMEGEFKAYRWIGKIDLVEQRVRGEDVPAEDPEFPTRWVYSRKFYKRVLFDTFDEIAMNISAQSPFMKAMAKGVVRLKNDVIHGAFFADVVGGKNRTNTYSLKADTFSITGGGRYIPHDTTNSFAKGGTSSGLTTEKLILARQALTTMHNDPNQVFNLVCSPKQVSDLLREAKEKEHSLQMISDMKTGEMFTYLGFNFLIDHNVSLEVKGDLDKDKDIYRCVAFPNDAVLYVSNPKPIFRVDFNTDKAMWQILVAAYMGAIRTDESKVVVIECA